jgi:hypothetical protein
MPSLKNAFWATLSKQSSVGMAVHVAVSKELSSGWTLVGFR